MHPNNEDLSSISQNDVDEILSNGFPENVISEVIAICSAAQYMNTTVKAHNIPPLNDNMNSASVRMMIQKPKEAFKTISEVSGELNIPQHVLRFWEKKFKQIKPMTRGGGRRLYRPEDVELLRAIHKLLYTEMSVSYTHLTLPTIYSE